MGGGGVVGNSLVIVKFPRGNFSQKLINNHPLQFSAEKWRDCVS